MDVTLYVLSDFRSMLQWTNSNITIMISSLSYFMGTSSCYTVLCMLFLIFKSYPMWIISNSIVCMACYNNAVYTIASYVSITYNCSCIVALADFSFIVKPIETLILLTSLLISLHRSSWPQRPSALIRHILVKQLVTTQLP